MQQSAYRWLREWIDRGLITRTDGVIPTPEDAWRWAVATQGPIPPTNPSLSRRQRLALRLYRRPAEVRQAAITRFRNATAWDRLSLQYIPIRPNARWVRRGVRRGVRYG